MLFICVTQINLPTSRCTESQEPNPNPPEPSPTKQPSASNSGSEKLAAKNAGSIQCASGAEGQSPAATGQSKPEGGRRLSLPKLEPTPPAFDFASVNKLFPSYTCITKLS